MQYHFKRLKAPVVLLYVAHSPSLCFQRPIIRSLRCQVEVRPLEFTNTDISVQGDSESKVIGETKVGIPTLGGFYEDCRT